MYTFAAGFIICLSKASTFDGVRLIIDNCTWKSWNAAEVADLNWRLCGLRPPKPIRQYLLLPFNNQMFGNTIEKLYTMYGVNVEFENLNVGMKLYYVIEI